MPLLFDAEPFGITQNLLAIGLLLLAVWAVWRSLSISGRAAEIGSWWVWLTKIFLYLLIFFAVCELQPFVLRGMFAAAGDADTPGATAAISLDNISKILAVLTAVVGLLSRPLAAALKPEAAKPGWIASLMKWAARLAIYIAGISIPFLLWIAYLGLSYWGICREPLCALYAPDWLKSISLWVASVANAVTGSPNMSGERLPQTAIILTYIIGGVILLIVSFVLSPNANSLHRLYRDRLSKAFLFDPTKREASRGARGGARKHRSAPPSTRHAGSGMAG